MTRPTYRCETPGCGWHVLAMVMPIRPGIYMCTPCLDARDTARDQWAAQTNITGPVDEDTRRLLGTWRITKGSAA